MLAHVGGHDGVLCLRADHLQHLLGRQLFAVFCHGGGAEGQDALFPCTAVILGQALVQQLQHTAGVADDVVVGQHVLVDLRAVDVDLDDLGLLGKGLGIQRHTVGEAAAHGDQQVALVTGHVRGLRAVHTDHAGGQRMAAGEAAAAHDGDGHGSVHLLGKGAEGSVCLAPDHAAAADQQRALGLCDHVQQGVDVLLIHFGGLQLVAGVDAADAVALAVLTPGNELVVHQLTGRGDVLQKVDEHRAGAAAGGHGEGLTHHIGDGLGVTDQKGRLGDGHGDAGGVHLLKSVAAQQILAHVAGDEHHGG